jgi:hypothetical protein
MADPRSRRAVLSLSASALLSLAGCVGVGSEPESSPGATTTAESTGRTSTEPTTDETTDHGNYRSVEITAHSAHPRDVARAVVEQFSELSERQREVVSSAIADGESVLTTAEDEPIDDGTNVAYEDAYYRVTVEVAAERERTAHVLRIDAISGCDHRYDGERLETARAEAVAFEDLPEADREAFEFIDEDRLRTGPCIEANTHHVYETATAVESSVLVSEEPTYVEYGDHTYLVEFRETDAVVEYDYRYETERIAETEAELHDVIVSEVVIDLPSEDLSADEREVLSEVTDVPFERRWENPIPESVDDLLNRLRSYETQTDRGQYFVRYRGVLYRIRVSEAVA